METRLEAAIRKLKNSRKDLEETEQKFQSIRESKLSEVSAEKRKLFEKTYQDFQRVTVIFDKAIDDMGKLSLFDLEEYSKMDLDTQLNYLKKLSTEKKEITDFINEEFETIQNKLLEIMVDNCDFGDHLKAVLLT